MVISKRTRRIAFGAGAVVLVALLAIVAMKSMAATAAAERAGEAFLGALRAGDVEAAYSQLSAARRAAMPKSEFAALVDHPAFRRHEAVDLRPPKEWSPGLCSYGSITLDGKPWAAELFFIQEGDGAWRVQSFAIQPPAPTVLGVLLEECGLGPHTFAGYSGPAIERSTRPLSPP